MKIKVILCAFLTISLAFPMWGCKLAGAGAGPADDGEITENIDSIIEEISDQLGEAPEDVIGFGAGYKKLSAITPAENAALLKLFRSKENVFAYYNMGCAPTVTADDMLTYDPDAENSKAAGYGEGNSAWIGKAGYNLYDKLGNLGKEVNLTTIDLVSIDKTMKKSKPDSAQAEIDRGSIYGYWIISLPDENILEGVVYDKGSDDKPEPVKKGTLHFKRVGPGPSSVDVKLKVNGNGHYESEGQLTAGHYEVSFDAKDGKGEKNLNKNWLYVPGRTPTQDWYVLVNQTYRITFDFSHYILSDSTAIYKTHMEWHDIPIDWSTESEEAAELATQLCFPGMYCLTYEYFENNGIKVESLLDNEDESEAEATPGYPPTVLTESAPSMDGGTAKLMRPPSLSFYRGIKGGMFKEDAYYLDLEYEVALYTQGQILEVPVAVEIVPLGTGEEQFFEKQGWGILSRIARLDEKAASDLITSGTPLKITYRDTDPVLVELTVVIQPEE